MQYDLEDLSALVGSDLERDIDDLLGLIANREIRITLAYLYDHPTATVDELAAVIAGRTAAEDDRIAHGSDYVEARISLHHSVLPRLDDHELVEFDPEDGLVREVAVPPAVYAVLGLDE